MLAAVAGKAAISSSAPLPRHPRGAIIAVDERRRVELFQRLATTLGEEAATTLSDLLPPRGDALATHTQVHELSTHITGLEHRLAAQIRESEARLSVQIDQRITDAVTAQTRTLVRSQLAALVAVAALAFGLQ